MINSKRLSIAIFFTSILLLIGCKTLSSDSSTVNTISAFNEDGHFATLNTNPLILTSTPLEDNIYTLRIEGLKNLKVTEAIHKNIDKKVMYLKDLAHGKEPFPNIEDGLIPQNTILDDINITPCVEANFNNVLSLTLFLKATYKNQMVCQKETLNFDLTTGQQLEINDVFKTELQDTDYISSILYNNLKKESLIETDYCEGCLDATFELPNDIDFYFNEFNLYILNNHKFGNISSLGIVCDEIPISLANLAPNFVGFKRFNPLNHTLYVDETLNLILVADRFTENYHIEETPIYNIYIPDKISQVKTLFIEDFVKVATQELINDNDFVFLSCIVKLPNTNHLILEMHYEFEDYTYQKNFVFDDNLQAITLDSLITGEVSLRKHIKDALDETLLLYDFDQGTLDKLPIDYMIENCSFSLSRESVELVFPLIQIENYGAYSFISQIPYHKIGYDAITFIKNEWHS